MVLKGLMRKAEAVESAILSLQSYPWNWSCWKLLWDIVDDHDVIERMRPLLPSHDHPLTRIFLIGVMIESHAMTPELEKDLDGLVDLFPHSLHIRTLQAHYAYSIRGAFLSLCSRSYVTHEEILMRLLDYDLSLEMFISMRATDPYRIDEVDTYSNILYTMKKQADLSQLAQHFMTINRDRPEVSLVIGSCCVPS